MRTHRPTYKYLWSFLPVQENKTNSHLKANKQTHLNFVPFICDEISSPNTDFSVAFCFRSFPVDEENISCWLEEYDSQHFNSLKSQNSTSHSAKATQNMQYTTVYLKLLMCGNSLKLKSFTVELAKVYQFHKINSRYSISTKIWNFICNSA